MELNYWEAAAAPPQVFDESDMMMSCIHDEQNNLEAELLLVGSHFLQSLHNNKSNDNVDNHFNEFNPHILLDPFYVTSCHISDITSLLNVENPTSFGHHLHPCPSDINFQPLEAVVDDGNSNARKASVENVVGNKRGVEGEMRSVTPQSIAARKRRRKITEKTQELGRLVPGGSKMNTAEMLTAAFNYVKFLQAQIGILRFMHSFHQEEVKAAKGTKLLQLAASPVIQEKLYMEQKCLIPKEFVEVLAIYFETQSKPSLSHNLDQLLKSSG